MGCDNVHQLTMASDPEEGSVRANAAIFSPVATCNNTPPLKHIKQPPYKTTSLNIPSKAARAHKNDENQLEQILPLSCEKNPENSCVLISA